MRVRNWAALAVGLAVCLSASYAAYTLADYSWNQVVDYRGPYAQQKLPEGVEPSPGSGRIVYVMVDGLREDVSRKMPTLNALRSYGYDAVVRTSQPSLSFPNWTTLLSGAPQRISGVSTNWFEGRVPVETLIDTALTAGRTVAVSAPTDFEALYGVNRTRHVFLRDWEKGVYMSTGIVDKAISLADESSASLLVVHLPDIDEAGHASGGASREYLDTAMKVDVDLGRLVTALQGPDTTFVVASDHGHIDTGGHGGPEAVVVDVPAVFAGPSVRPGKGTGTQDQVATTVAVLGHLPIPRSATGAPLDLTATQSPADLARSDAQQLAAFTAYSSAITGQDAPIATPATADAARAAFDAATEDRLASERADRLPTALAIVLVCLLAVVAIGALSWRALVAALSGTAMYYLVYEVLFFLVRGYSWSLSSFNSEDLLKAYLNGRMVDAVIAGVLAAVVAAEVYLLTRAPRQRPRGEHLPGWLGLGAATVLTIQATIGLQVAWYLWWWGASVSWYIPDLALGFKYDLDLIQLTGLAVAALVAPVVTYLIGRFHQLSPGGPAEG